MSDTTDTSASVDGAVSTAADVPDSSPEPAVAVPSRAAKMAARLKESKQQSPRAIQPKAESVSQADVQVDAKPVEGEKPKAKDPETIPKAAFLERLGRETEKVKGLRDQLQSRDLELAKAREAFQLLAAEYHRDRERLGKGEPIDARDEQLRSYELEKRVAEITERLTNEHHQRLQQQLHESRVAEIKEQLAGELEAATAQFPLVGRRELIAAMRENPNVDAVSLAKNMHEQVLESAKKYLVTPKPPAPMTASPSAGGIQQRYENSAQGMAARLKAMREARGI